MAPDPVSEPARALASRAVENLIARYAELVDGGDFTGLGAMFADASFGGESGAVQGSDAVERLFGAMVQTYDDGTPRTKHVTTNVQVEVDAGGTTASARSYVTVFQALPGFPLQPIVAGRYRDRFVCVGQQWRFAERRFSTDLVGDVSRHLRGGEASLHG